MWVRFHELSEYLTSRARRGIAQTEVAARSFQYTGNALEVTVSQAGVSEQCCMKTDCVTTFPLSCCAEAYVFTATHDGGALST